MFNCLQVQGIPQFQTVQQIQGLSHMVQGVQGLPQLHGAQTFQGFPPGVQVVHSQQFQPHIINGQTILQGVTQKLKNISISWKNIEKVFSS